MNRLDKTQRSTLRALLRQEGLLVDAPGFLLETDCDARIHTRFDEQRALLRDVMAHQPQLQVVESLCTPARTAVVWVA